MADPYALCYLNGAYLPPAEARISPLDRGFLFADGVYEVVPVHRHRRVPLARAPRAARSQPGRDPPAGTARPCAVG
jgi:D-alanine transaminase